MVLVQHSAFTNQKFITLPSHIAKLMGLHRGDEVEFIIDKENYKIEFIKVVPK